jgi:hypothetical protein
MKTLVVLAILVIGGSMLLTRGLEAIAPGSTKYADHKIEAQSVADYCTRAIPQVWDYALESGEDVDGVKGKLAYVAFNHVATGYCICNQERFGEDRTMEEKELFGKMAGLNIKMKFSGRFSKDLRERLKEEARETFSLHQSIVEANPAWLKTINKDFRACHKEQQLSTRLLSFR